MASISSIAIRPIRQFIDRGALYEIWRRVFEAEPSVAWLYHIPSSSATSNGSIISTIKEEQDDQLPDRLKRQYTNHLYLNPSLHIFFAYNTTTGEIVGMSAWEAPSQSPYSNSLRRRLSWLERLEAWYCAICDKIVDIWYAYLLPYLPHSTQARHALHLHDKKTRWAKVQRGFRNDHVTSEDERKGYWTLAYLGVLPSYGRRGIGRQLLQWGLDRADEEGRSVYISASVQGLGLYRKVRAEVVESMVCMEDEEMGGWVETWMRRVNRKEMRKAV